MFALKSSSRGLGRIACGLLCISLVGVALAQSTPSDPEAPGKPKAPPKLETRYTPALDAIRAKLPEAQWEIQQKLMSSKELAAAMGESISKEDKAVLAAMTEGEAMAANNFFDKQVLIVTVLRFKDQENAEKYMLLSHKITKDRFADLAKKTPGATMEIKEEDLMVIGTNGSRRLAVRSDSGPRIGSTFVNRFIKGPTFVEVMVVAKDPKKSVDMTVTEEAVGAIGRL